MIWKVLFVGKGLDMIYIFWSCSNLEEAKMIIHQLLEKKWIACASIFPEILSIYTWKGKVEESREVKVLLKTQKHHFLSIQNHILKNGSYEVPEIVQFNVTDVNPQYLSWILSETSFEQ